MILRLAALAAASTAALLAGLPALAQAPDFGDDTSIWANDGECDDPRFSGPGVSPSAIDADLMKDATDCRAAYEAGTAQLAGGQPAPSQVPAQAPAPGGKGAPAPEPAAQPAPQPAAGGAINFGDDSSEWANDGECDDRRFVGPGMATSIGWVNVGRDATDCRTLSESGQVRLWDQAASQAATQCTVIDFGNDSSEFANDGECDDPRFEGLGSASGVSDANSGRDASDCLQLCAYGAVSLRDY